MANIELTTATTATKNALRQALGVNGEDGKIPNDQLGILGEDDKLKDDFFPSLIIAGLRQGTKAELDAADPPLLSNEPAFETDTVTFRVGSRRYDLNELEELEDASDSIDLFSIMGAASSPSLNKDKWKLGYRWVSTRTTTQSEVVVTSSTDYVRALNWDGTWGSVVAAGSPGSQIFVETWLSATSPYNTPIPKMGAVFPCNVSGEVTGQIISTQTPPSGLAASSLTGFEFPSNIRILNIPFNTPRRVLSLRNYTHIESLTVMNSPDLRVVGMDQTTLLKNVTMSDCKISSANLQHNLSLGSGGGGIYIDNASLLTSVTLPPVVMTGWFTLTNNAQLQSIRAIDTELGYHHYNYLYGNNISGNNLSASALNQFFMDLAPGSTSIYVAGNPGSATCDPSIATAKGYTVVGV